MHINAKKRPYCTLLDCVTGFMLHVMVLHVHVMNDKVKEAHWLKF